jgi:hypothetical protein
MGPGVGLIVVSIIAMAFFGLGLVGAISDMAFGIWAVVALSDLRVRNGFS